MGSVPEAYITEHRLTTCSVCRALVSTRYHGTCPSCRPVVQAAASAAALRARLQPAVAQDATTSQERHALPSLEEIHTRQVPVLKHVPKEVRTLWSRCLAKTLAHTCWSNTVEAWSEQQMLAKCVLCAPPRAGKNHHNQRVAHTRNRLNRWLAGERGSLWADLPNLSKPGGTKRVSAAILANQRHSRCIDLCGEGAFSSGCKALTKGAPLSFSSSVMQQLRDKHPQNTSPPQPSLLTATPTDQVPTFTAESVDRAIRSFHRLSGAGPSGFRPAHLQEALRGELKDEILTHATSLVQLLAKGTAPRALAPYLAGATLTALPKKDGSVRPIAVGETLRRLTAKCLCSEVKSAALEYFFPLQIGVGQPRGTEVGLQTARQWCHRNRDNTSAVFVKVDYSNAFNTVDRQTFLEQCQLHFPGLAAWSAWCYTEPSHLICGQQSIDSQSGVQQGDPLGPLLFALALQPVLEQLKAGSSPGGLQMVFSYLDDLCLAGEQRAVAQAVAALNSASERIGLKLNSEKCEIIPCAGLHHAVDPSLFPDSFEFKSEGNFELLGGPVGCAEFCNNHTQDRVNSATKVLAALGELPDPQVALQLLRHCA